MSKLLLIDDDSEMRGMLARGLRLAGYSVLEAETCVEGAQVDRVENPDLLIVDYQLPDGTAFDVLEAMKERDSTAAAIVLTGLGSIDLAVRAIKAGAEHFLTKPVDLESLQILVKRTLDAQRERKQKSSAQARSRPNPFLGESREIRELQRMAEAVLDSDAPVLIQGETGTGKGVLARYLHELGPRRRQAYVDLNCAGFSRELVEAELFGYQRGAFTGAVSSKPGLIEVADKGTLFLDEIGDLDPGVQPKLLKVLEERSFRRIGELSPRSSDLRLIAATHRNLGALVRQDRFREDLLFRVNTITLEIPPLRQRPGDVPALTQALLAEICSRAGRKPPELARDVLERLTRYSWPGNIRELRNVLERALLFSKQGVIDRSALHFDRSLVADDEDGACQTLDEAERQHITRVMGRTAGHVEQAAKILALSRSSLYAKLKKYNIRTAAG
jgi:DNA-binding NtrC family response regulator